MLRSVSLGWVVSIVSVAVSGLSFGQASTADSATLRGNVVAWYTRSAPAPQSVRRYMGTLREDGSWPDVDYANTDRGGWATYAHLGRTLALAKAYKKPGHALAGAADLRAAVEKALAHWVDEDYRNRNWWYPQIGVPMAMAPILVLMDDDLPSDLKDRAIRDILSRSKMGMTGQNKVWLAGIAFLKGLLQNDTDLMGRAREQIVEELRITTAEGVQPDYSFHQHGPQLQWGNYGAGFSGNMIQWASVFHGTTYAFDPPRLRILGDYLAQGTAWSLWQGRMDISGCGRQIFRDSQRGKGSSALHQLELMTQIDPKRADTYRDMIASNRLGAQNAFVGHKHFWRSDLTVHRRPTWYASVKMSSTRVIGAETCNSENMLGLHLGDGVTYFRRTGAEYEDLYPVWDWQRLPGTTCVQSDRSLVPNSKVCRGRSDFVGGVTDGQRGLAAMEYIRDDLRARKAWFFLEEGIMCLGAGIDDDGSDPVLTSINQSVLNGPVTLSTGRQMSVGESLTDRLTWVHHDGMGYAFLTPTSVTVRGRTQKGDWHRVHHRETRTAVERAVFSLWIDHGAGPHDARYAYAVYPDVTAGEMSALADAPPFEILRQTPSILAISSQDGETIQAAFFEADRLSCGADTAIAVDAPCLILWDRRASRLYVADPTHRREAIHIRIAGRTPKEIAVDLPDGGYAGRTVSVQLDQ